MPTYRIYYATPFTSGFVPRNFFHEFSKMDDETGSAQEKAEKYAAQFIEDNKLNPSTTSLVVIVKASFNKEY